MKIKEHINQKQKQPRDYAILVSLCPSVGPSVRASGITTFDFHLYLQGHSAMICNKNAEIQQILLCLLYSTYSSGWMLPIFGTHNHWLERVCHAQWSLTLSDICKVPHPCFTIKLLRYGTPCRVCSTAHSVLDGFFPYLTQMTPGMRGCVNRPNAKVAWAVRNYAVGTLVY